MIPDIRPWLKGSQGNVNYFLTQALSSYGCFKKYLCSKRGADSDRCGYCEAVDNVEYMLFICLKWQAIGQIYVEEAGTIFEEVDTMKTLMTLERKMAAHIQSQQERKGK